MPNTKPGLTIDSEGICSACRSVEKKKEINWEQRKIKFQNLCNEIKRNNKGVYDCVVPVSGGKDSIYQVYMMSKIYKMKTLGIVVPSHLQTFEGISNLNALVENLNIDLIKVLVRPSTQKKLRRFGLFELGNPNFAEHRVIFAGVARTALLYNAPLVVWGEDIAFEFGGNISESSKNDGSAEDLINNDLFQKKDFHQFINGRIDDKELFFYQFPEKEELQNRKIKSIYLGYYHWWDGLKHFNIAKKFGFQPRRYGPLKGNWLTYDNIDEKLCELHIWFKFLKFGFWRPTDQCCYHIWNGYLSREDAVKIVLEKQYEFPSDYFEEFLEYHQITKDEFIECENKYRNKDIWHKVNGEWRLKNEVT
tara:strand:- start:274 stop:1362 length:1089 start_codon:yes stop_codon:yes gene_type:complete